MSEDKTYTTRLSPREPHPHQNAALRLELFFQGKLTVVREDVLPFTLGRDKTSCDLVIRAETTSRQHCIIVMRDRKIGVLDSSTNGTFIKPGRSDSVFIHHEFFPLVGQGAIKLGQDIRLDDPDILLYKVVVDE